ncbi:MAG: Holliday junction branch migration protein RuvA [Holosporaceae bacterium]|jgi:Holliday junction DNA helicase RuvA|nr:Holliday junction branch migration protein RuvA [Holosporaceae bacterium]
MITHLKGIIEKVTDNLMVLDVNGVGFSVICSNRTIDKAQSYSGIIHIFTVMSIREDSWTLYGFISEQERFWFTTLSSVQGVGGKSAIAILSVLSDDNIYNAFLSGDKDAFTRADGVGPKLATRIITELKDKIVGKVNLNNSIKGISTEPNVLNDVISALSNLGYQKADVLRVISAMQIDKDNITFDVLLKKILSKISSGV